MKQLAAFSLFFLLSLPLSRACSCLPLPTFCELVAADGNAHFDWSILHVRIQETYADSVKVKVLRVFQGENVLGHEFFIYDESAFNCGTSTDNLEQGDEYVFALALAFPGPLKLPGCDNPYLNVKGNKVKGAIAPGITSLSLDEFANLSACGLHRQWTLTPTLAGDELLLTTKGWDSPAGIVVRIFDATGRLVFEDKQVDFSSFTSISIDASNWSTGVYFCQVAVLGGRQTVKIVKAN